MAVIRRPTTQRVVAALLALVLAATWRGLTAREGVPEAPWLTTWKQAHPDPRQAGEVAARRHQATRARQRRDDLAALALALAAGCAVLALVPAPRPGWRAAAPRVLVAGGLALGLASVGGALGGLPERVRSGRWDPGDHALPAVAGPLADVVVTWRSRMGPDDAVIVAGTQDALLNTVAWALHPRPIHLVGAPVPAGLSPAEQTALGAVLPLAREAPARWLLDLDAVAAGRREQALISLRPFVEEASR